MWVAGESYGGDYVPDLVQRILAGGGGLKSQLEGFIIGNPVLSCPEWEATMNTIQVGKGVQGVCVWVCGCVGVWVCGCVGVWVCGCVCVCGGAGVGV